jgi:hypothetical protein
VERWNGRLFDGCQCDPGGRGTLPGTTTWSGLGRSYRFNVGVETEIIISDNDNDGMPDTYENAHGLDPNVRAMRPSTRMAIP